MSAEPGSRHSSAGAWITGAALAVVVYLLSPGLLVFLNIRFPHYQLPGWLDESIPIVYAPIQASMRFEPVRTAYSAYFSWCAGSPVSIPAPPP